MRLLIDTNRYAELLKPSLESIERLQEASEVWLSLITLGELRAGFAMGNRQQANEECLQRLLHIQGVGILTPGEATTHHYAFVLSFLKSIGRKIPTNDMWIAAQAHQLDLTLDSDDEHLRRVPGLKFIEQLLPRNPLRRLTPGGSPLICKKS